MPPDISDRQEDAWEPLLAIADMAGGHWPETARAACTALQHASRDDSASTGIRLLADLRKIFDKENADVLPTETVLAELQAIREGPLGGMVRR